MISQITTERTRIRVATAQDASFITTIENDELLQKFLDGPSGRTEEEYRQALVKSKDLGWLIVEDLAGGCSIGTAALLTGAFGFQQDCEIKVIVQQKVWRRGFGLEVARGLIELAARIYPSKPITAKYRHGNDGAKAILENLGFVFNGETDGWLTFHLPASLSVPPPSD